MTLTIHTERFEHDGEQICESVPPFPYETYSPR